MATHQIGNFKFNLSKNGLAFRFGEGDIHRLPFGRNKDDSEAPDNDYEGRSDDEYSYDENGEYFDENAQDNSEYPDESQDGYYDADSDNQDGYYDEQGESAEDYDAPEYYEGDAEEGQSSFINYIRNNIWVVWALLIILPPLGIYLLWKYQRHEFNIRCVLSAVSGIWFIIMLVLIFTSLFGGGKDATTLPKMNLTTTAPTQIATVAPSLTATVYAGLPTIEPDVSPSSTPLGGGTIPSTTDTAGDSASYVYSPTTGLYYHTNNTCENIGTGVSVSYVTLAVAKNRNQSACPICGGGTVYYGTKNGNWYHTDKNCQDMEDAVEYSKEAAEREGKTACPVCAGGSASTTAKPSTSKAKTYVQNLRNDKSGIMVYMTNNGKWYHTDQNCQDMSGAKQVTLLKAIQDDKTACPVCAAGAEKRVYCTAGGENYHLDSACRGMENAKSVTLAAALILGKTRCTTCVTEDFYKKSNNTDSDGTVYVYANANGKYYHTNSTCSDMVNPPRVKLIDMIKAGRTACPICAASAGKNVYVSKGGNYYHSFATCGGMTDAVSGTLAQALAYGYTACPDCWTSTNKNPDSTQSPNTTPSPDGNDGYSNVYVYASEDGKYYHVKKSCDKVESGATKILLELAVDDGKKPCPDCASTAGNTVYAAKGGTYYHKNSTCSDMKNAKSGTLAQALIHGYKACPICYGSSDNGGSTNKYKSGTSGVEVYASTGSKYYHTKTSCTNISGNAVKVTLEAALNHSKTACPVCAKSATRTVYATKNGKYYHYSSSCAGSSAQAGSLDEALAMGFKPCPNCVTGTDDDDSNDKFKSGTSGIKVYATTTGRYFHSKSDCGNLKNAKYITLENALNYGLTPCPDCAAAAGRTVYSAGGSDTYHYDKSCAGSGAKEGTLAEALAYGLKACSKCVTGLTPVTDDDKDGKAAPADTRVYIDLSGDSDAYIYHTDAKCSESGMKDGTSVTLKYAINHGYGDCGYCNPPTSLSD